MMCEECGVRPAKFHITTIAGDQKQERNLCPVCMAKYQKQLPGFDFANLAGLLSGFLEGGKNKSSEQVDAETAALVCEKCGMTYEAFQKGGQIGCAECYKVFKKPLEALLLRIHGNTQHAGRIPGGLKSDVAIAANIAIMRAFVQVREYLLAASSLSAEVKELRAKIDLLALQREDDLGAVNDLSEDVRKDIDNLYLAIGELSSRIEEKKREPQRKIGFQQNIDKD